MSAPDRIWADMEVRDYAGRPVRGEWFNAPSTGTEYTRSDLCIPRDQHEADVAAAYEAAARDCAGMAQQVMDAALTGLPEQARMRESMEAAFTKASHRIRALTPAVASATLARMLADAEAKGAERALRWVSIAPISGKTFEQVKAMNEGRIMAVSEARELMAQAAADALSPKRGDDRIGADAGGKEGKG